MIVGISGYAGSGKDTLAKYMIDNLAAGGVIMKFASTLKAVASLLTGIPKEMFEDQEFKKTYMSSDWDMIHRSRVLGSDSIITTATKTTIRDFLQKLGTDAIRNGLHENAWVNALVANAKRELSENPNKWVIVTDVRFPNEAEAIRNMGGAVVRIVRPGVSPVNAHISETALDDYDFDLYVQNDGTEEDLSAFSTKVIHSIRNSHG